MKKFLATAAIVAMTTSTAFSAAIVTFQGVDKSGDNLVSAGEIVAAEIRLDEFNEVDVNGDGYLTPQEWTALDLTKYEAGPRSY